MSLRRVMIALVAALGPVGLLPSAIDCLSTDQAQCSLVDTMPALNPLLLAGVALLAIGASRRRRSAAAATAAP